MLEYPLLFDLARLQHAHALRLEAANLGRGLLLHNSGILEERGIDEVDLRRWQRTDKTVRLSLGDGLVKRFTGGCRRGGPAVKPSVPSVCTASAMTALGVIQRANGALDSAADC
ncbi:hypothetical protein KHF85_18885 [Xanthomonas translucens pv. graminis]|uniref:hypothetical protein n=1 Tax=Xanthomonas graminis TaxID=3390026 RepID=UPI0025408594|nr:hypothetical protein [Xanthomonas translucens]WIH04796.1 hypothetical protein KHF85_18885 [Xanthomonas translucens pv. graminis]